MSAIEDSIMVDKEAEKEAEIEPIVQDAKNRTYEHIFFGPTVLVKVGPDLKEYHIHKDLLIRNSGFFRGALTNKVFQSAQEGIVELIDIDPDVFNGFAYWIYRGPVFPEWKTWKEMFPSYGENQKKQDSYNTKIVRYRNAPWYEAVIHAWDNLPENSPMLELLVDSHCRWWRGRDLKQGETQENIDALPSNFLYRAMEKFYYKNTRVLAVLERKDYKEPAEEAGEV
ncbi:hypothetical protein BU23DRAFT_573037 [Bimuria novae-zelandiae CBS 107.79]|uniref:BTB domain-containing protein n=1 Tax=Bimuria novae-zelandiae CBS 107.79 TaxID=1447943 RepID=A0A6A5UUW0_9PLEO|nr:hypothetical protein BU23DRAFT_573037 [Bimuria novae-zelandiae CBS 107.79]